MYPKLRHDGVFALDVLENRSGSPVRLGVVVLAERLADRAEGVQDVRDVDGGIAELPLVSQLS